MLCSECGKNEATIHSVVVINGEKTERHLCSECAKNHPELNLPFVNSMANFGVKKDSMQSLVDNLFNFGISDLPIMNFGELICKTCGETLSEFKQTGLLGCPDCYDSFADQLIPVIEKTHGTKVEKKKEEEKPQTESNVNTANKEKYKKIAELQQKLNEAISTENFEEAAKVRDEIKKLKGE